MKKNMMYVAMVLVLLAGVPVSLWAEIGHHPEGQPGPYGMCPVSGDAAKENVTYEHNGKTYHFCCKMCIGKFKKNPAKYLKA